jgi:hypothetical protein
VLLLSKKRSWGRVADKDKQMASTDPILALALVMAIYTTCSAILTQSYGKSLEQFWHIFALFWD